MPMWKVTYAAGIATVLDPTDWLMAQTEGGDMQPFQAAALVHKQAGGRFMAAGALDVAGQLTATGLDLGNQTGRPVKFYRNGNLERGVGFDLSGALGGYETSFFTPDSTNPGIGGFTFGKLSQDGAFTYTPLATLNMGGRLGLGTTSPQCLLHVGGSSGASATPTAITLDATYVSGVGDPSKCKIFLLRSVGGDEFYGFGLNQNAGVEFHSGGATSGAGRHFMFCTGGTGRIGIGATALYPWSDNAVDIGIASTNRVRDLFLVNSPTATSDANEKTVRGDGAPTEQERAWARAITPVCFQWNSAIEEKGEAARLHFSPLAQDVHQAGIDAGIEDPFRYGFLGRDPKMRTGKRLVPVTRQKVEMVPDTAHEIEMRDGRAVLVSRPVERPEPVFEELPVENEAGETVMVEVPDPEPSPIAGPNGEAIMRTKLVPAMHRLPVMETVEIEQDVAVPIEGEWLWNLRPVEMLMFVLWCERADQEAA